MVRESEPCWSLTDHVCYRCLGRIVERQSSDGVVARCCDCGLEVLGGYRKICTCGLTLMSGRPAGFYCAKNDNHKPGKTQEIIGLHDEWV